MVRPAGLSSDVRRGRHLTEGARQAPLLASVRMVVVSRKAGRWPERTRRSAWCRQAGAWWAAQLPALGPGRQSWATSRCFSFLFRASPCCLWWWRTSGGKQAGGRGLGRGGLVGRSRGSAGGRPEREGGRGPGGGLLPAGSSGLERPLRGPGGGPEESRAGLWCSQVRARGPVVGEARASHEGHCDCWDVGINMQGPKGSRLGT